MNVYLEFQDSVEHCIIGVTILSQLTNEINQVSSSALLIDVSVFPILPFVNALQILCCAAWRVRPLFPPLQKKQLLSIFEGVAKQFWKCLSISLLL